MFLINKSTKDNTEELKIRVVAKNVNTSVGDNFTLLVDPQLRTERIENEKKLKKNPNSKRLFLNQNLSYSYGEVFRNIPLALSLIHI